RVGSGFITSVRTMRVYERESDQALVVAAGVPEAWVRGDTGVTVRRLPTEYGVLNMTIKADGADAIRVRLSGDLTVPPGGIVVSSPLDRPITAAEVNGPPPGKYTPEATVLREWPAEVVLRYGARDVVSSRPEVDAVAR